MKKFNLLLGTHKKVFWLILCISVGLIIFSFFGPPMAEISSSVIAAVGELLAFYPLYLAGCALERGADITVKHNETEVTLNNTENNDEELL